MRRILSPSLLALAACVQLAVAPVAAQAESIPLAMPKPRPAARTFNDLIEEAHSEASPSWVLTPMGTSP